jgi:2-methylcitrate dehydratase PrpD
VIRETLVDAQKVGISRNLARHVAKLRFDDLQDSAVDAFKRALLDFLACAISGSTMPVSHALLSYFQEEDLAKTASVIGTGARLSASNAAFVNGANVHGLDFDDGYVQAAAHPGGAVFPAVLAVAEKTHAAAKDVIAAVVAGYDVMLRIGAAMHPAVARRGFHNTPVSGVFGAAAGVASLMKLDEGSTLHALGLAGSFAGGIREYLDEGAEIKRLHPGKAARDGIVCAELAKRGITGPSKVLEGQFGLFRSHVDNEIRWEHVLDRLGSQYMIESVYFKPYPCCRGNQTFIDAIRVLREKTPYKLNEIERLELGGYKHAIDGHDQKHHDNLLDAQMSLPCCAALAVVFGDVTTPMFEEATLSRPDVQGIIDRIHCYVDDEAHRLYPQKRSAFVSLVLRDGRKLERRLVDPKGEPANPMTNDDLEHKLRSNCESVIGAARCNALIENVWNFEKLEDVRPLVAA